MSDQEIAWLRCIWGWEASGEALYDVECPGCTSATFYQHAETILELLAPGPSHSVLNIGCGAGRVEAQWASRVREMHGVDFSESAIIAARAAAPANAHFVPNDGRSLPFLDGSFDLVFCETMFQHVPKAITLGYIDKIYRVLVPGGRCVLQIPRLDAYPDAPYCSGMSRADLDAAMARFSSVTYPAAALKQHAYHVPVGVK